MVVHSIFDVWHYEVLWTCTLTRLLWYSSDYVHLILYIMLQSTKLPNALQCTLPSKLSSGFQAHSQVRTQVHFQLHLMTLSACLTLPFHGSVWSALWHTPEYALKYTPIALNATVTFWLNIHSKVISQDGLTYTPEHALHYSLQMQDTPNLSWLFVPMYAPGCSIQRLAELQAPGTWRRMPGDERQGEAGRGLMVAAEIMTSVDTIDWTLLLARPPQQNLTMPHGHGVDNCSPPFCTYSRQSDLRVSWSLSQMFQRKLLPTSHRLWEDMYAFGPGLMAMTAIVIMAMVMVAMVMMAMVSVMVITVPVVLGQVGWLHPCLHQSFHQLRAFHLPPLPQT